MRQAKSLTLAIGVCLAAFSVGKVSITSASFSPDGTRIITSDSAGAVNVTDAKTFAALITFPNQVRGTFSPDGTRIITSDSAGIVKIFDAKTFEAQLSILDVLSRPGNILALFSPDASSIVTSSANGVNVWDSKTGQRIAQLLQPPDGRFSLSFSLDGTRLQVTNYNRAFVFEMISQRQIQRFEDASTSLDPVTLSPNGMMIAIGKHDQVEIRDTLSGANVVTFPVPGGAQSLCFSKDGTRILAGMRDHTARMWNTKTGKQLTVFRGHREWVRSAEFSPDQTKIVTASGVPTKCFEAYSGPADYTVRVWDAKSGRELRKFECHSGMVNRASFSPDGTRIISVSVDGTSKVLEVKSGKVLHTLN